MHGHEKAALTPDLLAPSNSEMPDLLRWFMETLVSMTKTTRMLPAILWKGDDPGKVRRKLLAVKVREPFGCFSFGSVWQVSNAAIDPES